LAQKVLEDLAGDADSVFMAGNPERLTAVKGTIDSTIAMLLIALDLCTIYGEGLLIGNNATLQRLLFEPGAPHSAAARHIWAHLIVPGNPMTGIDGCQWQENEQFYTGVIYFARDHATGPKQFRWPNLPDRVFRQGATGSRLTRTAKHHSSFLHCQTREAEPVATTVSRRPWLDKPPTPNGLNGLNFRLAISHQMGQNEVVRIKLC